MDSVYIVVKKTGLYLAMSSFNFTKSILVETKEDDLPFPIGTAGDHVWKIQMLAHVHSYCRFQAKAKFLCLRFLETWSVTVTEQ